MSGFAGAAVVLVLVVTGGAMTATTPDDFLDSEITAEMVSRSTVDLDRAASTVDVEQTVEKSDQRTVRLTSDLLFAFDSADLTDAAKAAIVELAGAIPDGRRSTWTGTPTRSVTMPTTTTCHRDALTPSRTFSGPRAQICS